MVLEITGGSSVIFENETYVVCKESTTLSITGSGTVNYLIIGGGGAGGISHGGGGGAGEVISGVFNATPGNYSAEVGLGGTTSETIGGSSFILNKTPTAIGGGRGGGSINGIASGGGSGGGGSGYVSSEIGGSSTISNVGGIGNAGGNGFKVSNFAGGGGGGGGSGSSGKTPLSGLSSNSPGAVGGSGITGYSSWINAIKSLMSLDWKTATSTGVIASGGSGGSWATGTFITGPPGGGGNGGDNNKGTIVIPATSGINNTGSGGGGGGSGNFSGSIGGTGGTGLIILKYGTNKFSISPNTLSVITNNYYSSLYTLNATNVDSYSISPAASSGLNFNTVTGILSGTLNNNASNATYTITATYTDLTTSIQQFSLTILNIFTVTASTFSATIGTTYTNFYSVSSGNVVSYSISPSLSSGLTFDTSTGILSGTLNNNNEISKIYTITATYKDLTTSIQQFTLAIANTFIMPRYYSGNAGGNAFAGRTYTNLNTITSGNVQSYSISPSISTYGSESKPTGLTFNTSTGIISGTPTINYSGTTYRITATFTDLTTKLQYFTVIINNPNSFILTPITSTALVGTTYTKFYNYTINNNLSFSISPSPSASSGLTFNTGSGFLSGTPTTRGTTTYTITLLHNSDSTTTSQEFTLTVINPNSFNLTSSTSTAFVGSTYTDFYNLTSDNVETYSISPDAPSGLTFNTSTGILSGTPTTLSTTPYTITATYTDLTTSVQQFTLTVRNPNSFNLNTNAYTATIGLLQGDFYSFTSDNVEIFSISPSPSPGLTFDTATGILSGTPTTLSTTPYTITATYTDLTTSIQYFTLSVRNPNSFNLTPITSTAFIGSSYTNFYSLTSDNVETFSINPSPSPGLTFNTATGILSGSPTTRSTTTYTITATNTDITTNVQQFTLTTINPNSFNLTKSAFNATIGTTYYQFYSLTSDNVVSYSISPSPSEGLTFNTSTCIFGGTPTTLGITPYIITAKYTDLTTSTQQFTVSVRNPNSFTLNPKFFPGYAFIGTTYTNFYSITSVNVQSYSIDPSPPPGTTFNTSTGILSGTPTTEVLESYTITATYEDLNTKIQYFYITVRKPNKFNLNTNAYTATIGLSHTDFYNLTSDNIQSFSIIPSPPQGLTFNTATGIISGTPTTLGTTPYTITATYLDLTTSIQYFTLSVKNPNSFNLTPIISTAFIGSSYTNFYSLTSDNVETFSINPSPSGGLTFNTSTGILSGSPTTRSTTTYTITATNTDITTNVQQFTLTIINPNSFNLNTNAYTTTIGLLQDDFYSFTSDNVVSYSISPSPSPGLTFDTATGILSGTPTTLGITPYTITAAYIDLTASTQQFTLTVSNPNSFNLTPITSTAFIGSIYTNLNTITSDNVETYSISPSPPQGLTFNTSTGILSGTPTTRSTTTYNITATYTDLTTSIQQFTLTVINPNRFNLTTSAFSATIGSTYTEFYGLSSDNVETYSISPSLSESSGLTFNTSTGILSGTPTTLSSTPYTITATYTDLTTSIQEFTLTVKNPNSFNLTTSTSTAFIGSTYTEFYGLSSDNVESYFISPSLSETSGLTFNTSTCILSGTPTTLGTTTYTITATYTDLTTSIQELTLTVRNPNSFNLTTSTSTAFVGSTYTEFYGLSSDNVETFSISPSPSGELIFNTSTGILSGTPTTISTTPYSITATYTDLTTSVQQFTLTVKNPNSFNLTPSAYTALVGSTYTEFYGLTSDNVETFSISPSPSQSGELTFDTATGILSGTPTTISTTPYTITATYTDLTTSVQQFTLTVKKPNKFNLTTNTSTATIGLSQTYFYSFTSDNVQFYSISPSPSASSGLTFNTATGILSGTLTTPITTTYTITATFIDLTTSIQELTLTVINPNSFNLTPSAFSAFIGSTYTELYSLSSENVVSYSISPSPSASSGLIFNQATGILSGSPTTRDTTPYTITATYIDLTTSIQYFTLTVKNRNRFNLTSTAYIAFIGTTYTDFYSLTSDNVETFSISPSLSGGLIFNPATGILSGTPNTPITTAYSITATYADLTTSVEQFTLTVKNPNSFNITPSAFSATIGSSYTNFYSFTSDNVQSYSIDPIPSSGLIFNTATGILRGTPDNIGTTTYTITVNYDDGSTSSQTYELTIEATCFLKGSKILTDKGYIAIENLRKGDLVKTFLNNYKAILMIGKNIINHNANKNRIKDQLYKYSKGVYPELTDDLIISGGHSILVNDFETEEQKSANIKYFGEELPKVDGLYKLLTYVNEKSFPYNEKGDFEIYHLSLENKEIDKEYGIYANGLLVESCSIIDFIKYSGLKLIE